MPHLVSTSQPTRSRPTGEPSASDSAASDPLPTAPRVLQLGAGWFPEDFGGLERVYYELTRHLPDAGIDPMGLVTGSPDVDTATDASIRAFARKDAPLLARWWRMRSAFRRMLKDSPPDLITAHFALYAFPVLDLLPADIPFVMHFHGPWASEGNAETPSGWTGRVKQRIERAVYQRADRAIVLSEAFANVLSTQFGVARDQIEIVPGGVHVETFAPKYTPDEARQNLGWPDRPTILSVRRLTRRMGLENLIDAIDTVRATLPDVQLMIAGKGPIADELNAQIRERGLDDHVRLLGFVSDEHLPLAYRAADVSIVPTIALEGFGLITLESMASGTPVLVTPIGGLPEAVRGLSESLILNGSATEDLADGLIGALTGKRDLPSPEMCLQHVRSHHDWPVIARQTAAIYNDILSAR